MRKKIFAMSLLALSLLNFTSCGGGKKTDSSGDIACDKYYHVTYYLNDGTDSVYYEADELFGATVTRPENPKRDNFTFKGWCVDPDCYVTFYLDTPIKADTSLYAKWQVNTTVDSSSSSTTDSSSVSSSVSSSGGTTVNVTYIVDGMPEWVTNDGCVIFAWVWSDTNMGMWVSTTYTSETSLTFTIGEEITGMLLARCVSGTTEPDWAIKDDEVGRIYNQTEDIAVTSGVLTYTCASWKEYNPY